MRIFLFTCARILQRDSPNGRENAFWLVFFLFVFLARGRSSASKTTIRGGGDCCRCVRKVLSGASQFCAVAIYVGVARVRASLLTAAVLGARARVGDTAERRRVLRLRATLTRARATTATTAAAAAATAAAAARVFRSPIASDGDADERTRSCRHRTSLRGATRRMQNRRALIERGARARARLHTFKVARQQTRSAL